MDDRLSLQLHSINATLLMIFGAVASFSPKEGLNDFGGMCLAVGGLIKVIIWMSLIAYNLQSDKPPKDEPPPLASPPLDVD